MKLLNLLLLHAERLYYQAALRNMQRTRPLHPDTNYLVMKVNAIKHAISAQWARR